MRITRVGWMGRSCGAPEPAPGVCLRRACFCPFLGCGGRAAVGMFRTTGWRGPRWRAQKSRAWASYLRRTLNLRLTRSCRMRNPHPLAHHTMATHASERAMPTATLTAATPSLGASVVCLPAQRTGLAAGFTTGSRDALVTTLAIPFLASVMFVGSPGGWLFLAGRCVGWAGLFFHPGLAVAPLACVGKDHTGAACAIGGSGRVVRILVRTVNMRTRWQLPEP